MNNINVIIVEDDSAISEDIKDELVFQGYNIVGIFDTGEDAIKTISKIKPHIAILDIELKGQKSGIDVARFIDSSLRIPYIFLSNHIGGEFYNNAIKTKFANYLPKPFLPEQLNFAIHVAIDTFYLHNNQFAPLNDSFLIKDGKSFYNIYVSDIVYIDYDNTKRTKVYTQSNDTTFIIPTGLEDFIRQFPHPNLIRINRTQIINLKLLSKIDSSVKKATLKYSKEQDFVIGSSYYDRLLSAFTVIKD